MLKDTISTEKFITGIKYGLIVETVVGVFLALLWWVWIGSLQSFPIALYTFGFGGIYFTVAGCIGPGRYQKTYNILLYTPETGSSFSDEIKVSGFVVDENIDQANVVVNGKKVGILDFDDQGLAETTVSRQDFIYETINTVYLDTGSHQSNASNFTLFEYSEDMSDEEIEELAEMETTPPVKSLADAKESYIERTSGRIGSIAVGLGTLGVINFLFGIVLDAAFGIIY